MRYTIARVEPRAICCFYDLKHRTYNNSVGRASSDTLAWQTLILFRPVQPPRSGVLHHRNPRGVREYARRRYIARPLLILVLDGEQSSIPFAILVESPFRFAPSPFRSTSGILALERGIFVHGDEGYTGATRRGGVYYTRVVAAKISFRFPSCIAATYCDLCSHTGVL